MSCENKVNWLASFRGRAGLALDNNLLYVTGGVALPISGNNTLSGQMLRNTNFSETRVGWVAGMGVEHKYLQTLVRDL